VITEVLQGTVDECDRRGLNVAGKNSYYVAESFVELPPINQAVPTVGVKTRRRAERDKGWTYAQERSFSGFAQSRISID
jgi:hypothetical protein